MKLILSSSVLCTVLAIATRSSRSGFSQALTHGLTTDGGAATVLREPWRILVSLLPSSTIAEALVTWFLLYRMRIFERQMGSSRFAMFAFISLLVAMGARAGLLMVPGVNAIASGPYEFVFALLVYYYATVPKLQPNYFSIAGVKFSDKSLTYVIALQLLGNAGLRSVLPAIVGVLFGIVHMSDLLYTSHIKFPRSISGFFTRYVNWWWDSAPPRPEGGATRRSASGRRAARQDDDDGDMGQIMQAIQAQERTAGRRGANLRSRGGASPSAGTTDAFPRPEPNPEALQRLIDMGFASAAAQQALSETFNDENAAVNRLLEQMNR